MARSMGARVPRSLADCVASPAALAEVVAALDACGVVALAPTAGLEPAALGDFVRRLSRAAGGAGRLQPVISDLRHWCARLEGEAAAAADPHVALIMTNITAGGGADAAGPPPAAADRGRALVDGHYGSPPGRAAVWHQDEQFRERPAHLTALYCVEAAPDGLGDTTFADTAAGYDALPPATRRLVEGASASHSLAGIPMTDGSDPLARPDHSCATHPLALALPRTGRRCLYIGSMGAKIAGLGVAEGAALLQELLEQTTAAGTYTHHWRPGDLVLMDNRSMLHTASGKDYGGARRLMVRVQCEEPAPLRALAAAQPGPARL
jgi:alpha-ketoglutarate-dependent taurine dioxygenase